MFSKIQNNINNVNIMEHRNLSDELRNQIMEAASWGKADVTVRLNEKEVVNEQPVIEEARFGGKV